MTPVPVWVIMPVRAHRDYTIAAIGDVLQQSQPVILLVINQGVDDAFRTELERVAENTLGGGEVLLWSHVPPLPSLSATWNRALDAAWAGGAEWALVVNNDVRLHSQTVQWLRHILERERALFVSCVGVTAEQFDSAVTYTDYDFWDAHSEMERYAGQLISRGGPDFSCFLISKACHARFKFDEQFIPAFCEDLDYHRRLMLAGEGVRIFSVNLPYLHYASATLKALPQAEADKIRQQIESVSRVYYAKKWGGPVNAERYLVPFGHGAHTAVEDGTATTPYLQAHLPSVDPRSGTIAPTMDQPLVENLLFERAAAGELLSDRENDHLQSTKGADHA